MARRRNNSSLFAWWEIFKCLLTFGQKYHNFSTFTILCACVCVCLGTWIWNCFLHKIPFSANFFLLPHHSSIWVVVHGPVVGKNHFTKPCIFVLVITPEIVNMIFSRRLNTHTKWMTIKTDESCTYDWHKLIWLCHTDSISHQTLHDASRKKNEKHLVHWNPYWILVKLNPIEHESHRILVANRFASHAKHSRKSGKKGQDSGHGWRMWDEKRT